MRTNASGRVGDDDGAGLKFSLACFFLREPGMAMTICKTAVVAEGRKMK